MRKITILLVLTLLASTALAYDPEFDVDGDRVSDFLEQDEKVKALSTEEIGVTVLYNSPLTEQELDNFRSLGGSVNYVYRHALHGFAGGLPANNIRALASTLGESMVLIEGDYPTELHNDVGAGIIRARTVVWDTYNLECDSNSSIAVLDTGIDDTHPDFSPYCDVSGGWNSSCKLVGWHDATLDGSANPEDFGGHGSHVAGTAAGSGDANTNSGVQTISTTLTGKFPSGGGCWLQQIEAETGVNIDLILVWESGGDAKIRIQNTTGEPYVNSTVNAIVATSATGASPRTLSWAPDRNATYITCAYATDSNSSGEPYFVNVTRRHRGPGDAHSLFQGIAPQSKVVMVKIFENDGTGNVSAMIAGIDWVAANKEIYHIKVATMSASITNGGTSLALRNASNNLTNLGVPFTVSAGNNYPDHKIGDAGIAENVITVAASNDWDELTDYSSNGPIGYDKPDITAPGGSGTTGRGGQIESVDSNDLDGDDTDAMITDKQPNDYTSMHGTSMATPLVSGLIALLMSQLTTNFNRFSMNSKIVFNALSAAFWVRTKISASSAN